MRPSATPSFARRDLALGIGARKNLHRSAGAAAPGERRQRLQRSTCAAEMIDQRAEGARARYDPAQLPQEF